MGSIRFCLIGWLCSMVALASAAPGQLDLPCYGTDGAPRAKTEMFAIRIADLEKGRAPKRVAAQGARCSLALEAGTYWVKAQSPGWRSVPILVRWPTQPVNRTLVLMPVNGRDLAKQEALHVMAKRDREARLALSDAQRAGDSDRVRQLERAMEHVDADNTAQLRRWVAEKGFPRASDVGYEGVGNAWLLAQHSPLLADLLPQLRAAAQVGELARSNLALSEDRVRMQTGRPQRYGSQLQPGPDGKPALYRLESAENIDSLRESMDLEPLADYLKRFER